MQQQQPGLNIDLANTQAVLNENGGVLFGQGIILRKVSKFVAGTNEDALIPIPVFYDLETKKVVMESVPQDLRDELKDQIV
jgi:hypothetical protein